MTAKRRDKAGPKPAKSEAPEGITRAQLVNVVLFTLSLGTAAAVLFRPAWSEAWLRRATYFTMMGVTGAWLVRVAVWARSRWPSLREVIRANAVELLFAVAAMILLFATHDGQFKVFADETNFIAAARSLAFEGRFELGDEAKFFGGTQHFLSYMFDKRPPLFTFVLSLVSSVTGYRVSNGWLLNGALFGATIAVAAGALRRRIGRPWNLIAVGWAIANPIVMQTAGAAGVEPVLGFLWVLAGVLVLQTLEDPASPSFPLLVATVVLLGLARVESGPVGVVMLIATVVASTDRAKLWARVRDDWLVWCGPIVALPVVLVGKVNANDYFQQGGRKPFSLRYVGENITNWRQILADGGLHQPFNAVVTVTEVLAVVVLVVLVVRKRTTMTAAETRAFGIFSALTAAFFAIYSTYHWGQPSLSTSARLYALPFFAAGLAVPVVLRRVPAIAARPIVAIALSAAVFAHALPGVQETAFLDTLAWRKTHRIVTAFLEPRMHGHNLLLVTDLAAQYTIYDVGAVTTKRFRKEEKAILRDFEHHLYDDVFFVEELNLSNGRPLRGRPLDPSLKVETVLERQYSQWSFMRISRLVRAGEATPNPS